MGREQDRISRRIEKNPVVECNKIQKKYCPELFRKFAETLDQRHQSYIDYSNKVMLGTMYYKGIAGLVSMQSMTYEFNDDNVARNIMSFLGERDEGYLPHGVTVNEYLEKLDTVQLQEIQQSMVYDLIRRKTFDDARGSF